MRVWALRDLPTAMACLAREQNKTRRIIYADSLRWAIHRFPCAEVLPFLDPALVYGLDLWAWWVYLPFEDREAGFRYFEKHARVLQSEAEGFLATVVRFEPARAVALARQRQAVEYVARGLARHWPDRIGELLKPEDGKDVWNAVAVIMAHYHPEKVIAVLEAQPFQEAWDEAGGILNGRPELMKAITPRMSGKAPDIAKNNHPHLTGPMPPDPVTVNRVAGPLTPASLAVWQLTSSPSDFLWRMLKATETLTTPQLRTLTLDLLRVRRFSDEDSPQDWLAMSAWADREPAVAVGELLNLSDWEDRDDNIGDYDSDVEFLGVLFWSHLADRDFPAAFAIAEKLEGGETLRQFFDHPSFWQSTRFSPTQAAGLVKLAAKLQNDKVAGELAREFVLEMASPSGIQTARALVNLLPHGVIRDNGEQALQEAETDPKPEETLSVPQPALPDARLKPLQELDSRDLFGPFPFPLFRAIRALAPAEAGELEAQFPQTASTAGWLGWLLAMQAREGDQPANWLPVPLPPYHWYQDGSGPDTPEAAKIRALLVQAAAGKYEATLAAAADFRMSPKSVEQLLPHPSVTVMMIQALQDFPAAVAYVAQEKDEEKRAAYMAGLDRAMHRLPCADVLPHIPPTAVFWGELDLDAWLRFLPFEDREAGFRYFEANLQLRPDEGANFLATAARFEPARAVALARQQEGVLPQTAGGLATHWPDRIGEFLKPGDGPEVWKAVARSLAEYHPEKLLAVLKSQPHRQAWLEGIQRMSLQKKKGETILLELKANLPPEPAPPPEENLPDPFKDER
jgi:hypothetical protein